MSCGTGYGCSLDLELLRLWRRPAASTPIQPLAWELPYVVEAALKRQLKKKKKKNETNYTQLNMELAENNYIQKAVYKNHLWVSV